MSIWEDFEIQCTNYLNKTFGKKANFIHQGGTNSTTSDILVCRQDGYKYFFEIKHCPAQFGQFVLIPNLQTKTFDYSPLNVTPCNKFAKTIMDIMNKDFDNFKEAGTTGKNISFPNAQTVFTNWITTNYVKKNVKFIITNNYKILPLEDFGNAFDVSAKYRIKRSGSSSIGKNNIQLVKNHLIKNYDINSIDILKDKLFIISNCNLHNKRFIINGNEFMFSNRGESYEIRKLSNTFNANVIFSIEINLNYRFLTINEIATLI